MLALIAGFLMATLGAALLCLGQVPFLPGKSIPALRSRLIGLVLLGFLPLAFGARHGVNTWLGNDAIDGQILTWSLFGMCWFVVIVLLFRVVVPRRHRKQAAAATAAVSAKSPFEAAGPMEEAPGAEEAAPWTMPEPTKKAKKSAPAPTKKPRKPSAEENDPFNFG